MIQKRKIEEAAEEGLAKTGETKDEENQDVSYVPMPTGYVAPYPTNHGVN